MAREAVDWGWCQAALSPGKGVSMAYRLPGLSNPPEAVAESWVSAGWDRNHGSSSFCIATWLGDTGKKKKGPKKRKKIRNSNNDISLLADQVC